MRNRPKLGRLIMSFPTCLRFWPMAMATALFEQGSHSGTNLKFVTRKSRFTKFGRSLRRPNRVRLDLRSMVLRDYGAQTGLRRGYRAFAGHTAVIATITGAESDGDAMANGIARLALTTGSRRRRYEGSGGQTISPYRHSGRRSRRTRHLVGFAKAAGSRHGGGAIPQKRSIPGSRARSIPMPAMTIKRMAHAISASFYRNGGARRGLMRENSCCRLEEHAPSTIIKTISIFMSTSTIPPISKRKRRLRAGMNPIDLPAAGTASDHPIFKENALPKGNS